MINLNDEWIIYVKWYKDIPSKIKYINIWSAKEEKRIKSRKNEKTQQKRKEKSTKEIS